MYAAKLLVIVSATFSAALARCARASGRSAVSGQACQAGRSPGSGRSATDVFARKIGQILSEQWGQPVIIENRAGAGGVIGTEIVAKSAPDGYTLLVTYAGSQAINPSLYPGIPFDSIKDFQTVATLAVTPFVLIVNPKLPSAGSLAGVHCARERQKTRHSSPYASSGNEFVGQSSARRDAQGRTLESTCCTFPTKAWLPRHYRCHWRTS